MNISSKIFEAYLHCPTKCWLMLRGDVGENNVSAEWMREKNQAYRVNGIKCLSGGLQADEYIPTPPDNLNAKTASWRLASDFPARSKELESCIHSIERTPSEGRGKPAQFVPIRFATNNKLTKLDKLLIAFDAHILGEALKREITHGKLIHGDGFSTLKVKTPMLVSEVKKIVGKISSLLTGDLPPDLILNRHCPECDYLHRCRENAIEKDDLSLLGGMTEKEHKKLKSKGIFTVTQLSYTFRPRRRPKRLRDKREKYHHSLKALAIREKKIHIVGGPELKIEGTPVYLDVEGLPDRDFYYLIGVRIRQGDSVVHHSLWADRPEDEEKVWREFVDLLLSLENPVLIHYGSYETTFIKTMCSRYGGPYNPIQTSEIFKTSEVCDQNLNHKTSEVFKTSEVSPEKVFPSAINLLSVIYGHVYFPVASNGLKEIAGYCGFQWSETLASGLQSIVWREKWEASWEMSEKDKLIRYNADDCEALELVTVTVQQIGDRTRAESSDINVVNADSDKFNKNGKWQIFTSPVSSLEYINSAAHWIYQRDRVNVRLEKSKPKTKKKHNQRKLLRVDTTIICKGSRVCPKCSRSYYLKGQEQYRTLHDIVFGRRSLKLRLVSYVFKSYVCRKCGTAYGIPDRFRHKNRKYGWNLLAYFFYQVVDLCIPQRTVVQSFNRLFDFDLSRSTLYNLKIRIAKYYDITKKQILERIISGDLIHVDETRANIKGKSAYVWILASHNEVVYFIYESREGEIAHKLLANFKGVLVSDFYTAYDSIDCPQQKCLIHLMRDLNDEVLNSPFDEQLKEIVVDFGELLKPIVETIDRYGLKKYFLKRHISRVEHFFIKLQSTPYVSEAALKCKDRFARNKEALFTFLKYDGVPWNNNNAEHAVKAFAKLRDIIEGSSTIKGTSEYLILLSICQTCKYRGLDFLDFLRSGEKDLDVFAASQRRRSRSTKTRQTSEVSKNLGGLVVPLT